MRFAGIPEPGSRFDRFMMAALAALVLALVIFGLAQACAAQDDLRTIGIRIETTDGEVFELIGAPGQSVAIGDIHLALSAPMPGADRLRVKARYAGRPFWDKVAPAAGDAVQVRSASVLPPKGWRPEYSEELHASLTDGSWWSVVTPVLDVARHQAIPWSGEDHALEGGETWAWDLVPTETGDRWLPEPGRPPAEAARRLMLMGALDETVWPRLAGMRRVCTMGPGDERYDAPFGTRGLGWYMRWRWKRFAYGAQPPDLGHWKWGSVRWAEGDCNAHYDLPRACAEEWLRHGEEGSWKLAYLLSKRKACKGFIWTDARASVAYRWHYEKTTTDRFDYRGPEESHGWDGGLLTVAHLSRDADLLEVARLRGDRLLAMTPDQVWKGFWGVRQAAWHLECLVWHFGMTGDVRFRDNAATKIHAWCAIQPASRHWPERGTAGMWWPWQDALMCAVVAQALQEGVPVTAADVAIVAMRAEAALDGTRFRDVSGIGECLEVSTGSKTDGSSHTWAPPDVTSMFLPIVAVLAQHDSARFGRHLAAARRSVAGLAWQIWQSASVTLPAAESDWGSSSYGNAIPKVIGTVLWGARDWCFEQEVQ